MNDEPLNLPDRTDELESEYRRGYCDGFIQAVEGMGDAVEKHDFQSVYDAFWTFWEQDLHEWQYKNIHNHSFLPPSPPIR